MSKTLIGLGARVDTYNVGKKKGKIYISGHVWHKNALFEYSLTKQTEGSYVYKGSVRAISATGDTLKKDGTVRKEILENNKDKGLSNNALEQKLRLSKVIKVDILDKETILKCVHEKADKLYKENPGRIAGTAEGSVTSETITPQLAVESYGYDFLNRVYQSSSDERKEILYKRLKNIANKLDNRSMMTYPKTRVAGQISRLGVESTELLNRMWDYCLERGICEGENPVILKKKKKRSAKSKQLAAMRIEEISEEQLFNMLDNIEKNVNGPGVGTALMASGFKPVFLETLRWKDVLFRQGESYVVIRNIHNERVGGTKDFSRPVLPRVADIIKLRYSQLRNTYSPDVIFDMPVVSTVGDPAIGEKAPRIIQDATRLLKEVAVSNFVFKALNDEDQSIAAATKLLNKTYGRLLSDKCNIYEDTGSFRFLCDLSLGSDSTSKNYTSFTDKAGERRLHDILMCTAKVTNYKKTRDAEVLNHQIRLRLKPNSSAEYLAVKGEIIVPPGGTVVLECDHGTEGEYNVSDVSDGN